jgi:hypothetical protein
VNGIAFVLPTLYALLLQLAEVRREGLSHPIWRWTAIGTLLPLPRYRVGDFADFTTKASVPAILVLQLCIARAVVGTGWHRLAPKIGLVVCLLIGSVSAYSTWVRGTVIGLHFSPPPLARVRPTNELERRERGGQLFSDGKGFFWEYLGGTIQYQANEPEQPRPRGGQ